MGGEPLPRYTMFREAVQGLRRPAATTIVFRQWAA